MRRALLIDVFVTIVVVLVLVAAIFVFTGRAKAQGFCAPWTTLQAQFAARYGEVPIGDGVVNATTIATVLASPDGATWTLVIVDARGMGCAIAAGKDWEPGKTPSAAAKERRS